MRMKIFRILVCLVVICAMLVNVSPIKAQASSLGTLVGASVGVVAVSVGVAAMLNALGIRQGSNTTNFYDVVNFVYDTFTDWLVDGGIPVFCLAASGGNVKTYFPADMLQSILDYLFGHSVVESNFGSSSASFTWMGASRKFTPVNPKQGVVAGVARYYDDNWYSVPVAICEQPGQIAVGTSGTRYDLTPAAGYYAYRNTNAHSHSSMPNGGNTILIWTSPTGNLDDIVASCPYLTTTYSTGYDLALGDVHSDIYEYPYGDTAVQDDEDNWYVPVTIPSLSTDVFVDQEQEEAQAGTTPEEVIDQIIGEDVIPGTGSGSTTVPDTVTLQDVLAGILALPQSIGQAVSGFFSDVVSTVQAIPAAITDFFTITPEQLVLPVSLFDYFPFCIPRDIRDLVRVFDAEPEAPHFVFDVNFPYMEEPWHIDIDFSAWDPVALVLRRLELALFIVGLAMATRNFYIRG